MTNDQSPNTKNSTCPDLWDRVGLIYRNYSPPDTCKGYLISTVLLRNDAAQGASLSWLCTELLSPPHGGWPQVTTFADQLG